MNERDRYDNYEAASEGNMDSAKRSVLVSVIGILAAIGLMVGVGYGIAKRVGARVRQFEPPRAEQTVTGSLSMGELEGFDSIQTSGGWTVSLTPGSGYSVDVTANNRALDQIDVYLSGNTLHFEVKPGVRMVTGSYRATVTLPDLERISSEGGTSVILNGFELDNLEVSVEGAASVTSRGGRITNLDIRSEGAATFDFSATPVENADLDMEGVSNLDILMAGGELTGVLEGAGNVTYSGEVSRQTLDSQGAIRVHRN